VRDEAQVKAAIDQTISRFGQLDIIVNNAGIGGYRGPTQTTPSEDWDEVMAVNLNGVFYGVKHALPHMIERGYGRIINTASQLAHKPSPYNPAYCASKAGVVALTASVAQEVALQGITVNAVCPGPTETPMLRRPGSEESARWKIDSLPMKRAAEPIEIAWAYVYLASDEASYCTGQSISPNGGDVMW
jgi:NAD(P)-dependent dehydrogenase (short-subunit alcohol dehydrogenase family)